MGKTIRNTFLYIGWAVGDHTFRHGVIPLFQFLHTRWGGSQFFWAKCIFVMWTLVECVGSLQDELYANVGFLLFGTAVLFVVANESQTYQRGHDRPYHRTLVIFGYVQIGVVLHLLASVWAIGKGIAPPHSHPLATIWHLCGFPLLLLAVYLLAIPKQPKLPEPPKLLPPPDS